MNCTGRGSSTGEVELHSTMVLLKLLSSMCLLFFLPHLHSTMVLLKFIAAKQSTCYLNAFTFHYGSTKIVLSKTKSDKKGINLHSTMVLLKCKFIHDKLYEGDKFTFLYGSTKILPAPSRLPPFGMIYIPLWFY